MCEARPHQQASQQTTRDVVHSVHILSSCPLVLMQNSPPTIMQHLVPHSSAFSADAHGADHTPVCPAPGRTPKCMLELSRKLLWLKRV